MKNYLIISIFLIILSCNNDYDLVGKYEYKDIEFGAYQTLELLQDSTYSYSAVAPGAEAYSNGNWSINDNYLILNSSKKESDFIHVEENITNSEKIAFFIKDEIGIPLGNAKIFFNDKFDSMRVDSNGIGYSEKIELKNIIIEWLGRTAKYSIINQKADQFNIFMDLSGYNYVIYNNEKMLIKSRKLFWSPDFYFSKVK